MRGEMLGALTQMRVGGWSEDEVRFFCSRVAVPGVEMAASYVVANVCTRKSGDIAIGAKAGVGASQQGKSADDEANNGRREDPFDCEVNVALSIAELLFLVSFELG
jgi:hypothetical protein